MNEEHEFPSNADRRGEENALRRAERQAREIAARTGTPLVIYRDGKIEKRGVDGAVPVADEQADAATKPDS